MHWRFTENQESDGRRRKSDKRVDGNSSLSLSSPLEKEKKNPACAANINKPSFRWRVTQGVVLPPTPTHPCPCGNGYCAGAGDGFKSLTRQLLFAFSGPLWNCSRWKWGQSADIWMTVCLVVRHNHQLSDPVNGVVKAMLSLIHACFLCAFSHFLNVVSLFFPFFFFFNAFLRCKYFTGKINGAKTHMLA